MNKFQTSVCAERNYHTVSTDSPIKCVDCGQQAIGLAASAISTREQEFWNLWRKDIPERCMPFAEAYAKLRVEEQSSLLRAEVIPSLSHSLNRSIGESESIADVVKELGIEHERLLIEYCNEADRAQAIGLIRYTTGGGASIPEDEWKRRQEKGEGT